MEVRVRLSVGLEKQSGVTRTLTLFSTQGRARTGTSKDIGVWDQRVYQFRHLGIWYYGIL